MPALINPATLPMTDEIFSWSPPEGEDNSEMLHFAASQLRRDLSAIPPAVDCRLTSVHLDPQFAQFCIRSRGIEWPRCDRWFRIFQGPAKVSPEPLLFCHFPDGSNLLIDGTHRYVAAAMAGLRELPAWIVPEIIWRRYLVDLPAEPAFLSGWSGISP